MLGTSWNWHRNLPFEPEHKYNTSTTQVQHKYNTSTTQVQHKYNTSTTQVQQASLCCTFSWLVDKTCSCYINVPRQRIELSHDCWMALYLRELGGSKHDSLALIFNLHSSLRSCCKHKHITETLLKHLTVSFSLMKGPASYHGSSQDESQSSKSSGILGIEQVPALESDSRIVIIVKESKCLMMSHESAD